MCSLLTQILSSSPETYSSQIETDVGDSQNCGRYFRNKRDCELEPDLEIWEATTRWQCNQLYHNSHSPPPIDLNSQTHPTHTCTQIFLPSFLPTDRPLCSYTQKFLHNYLDAAANHLLPSFFLRALSLSLSRLPKLILSPLPKNCSLKTGGTSPNLNQLKNAFILSSLLHRHSTRRKQRTSLTLWDLRPLLLTIHRRQPGVGAIYERFFFFLQLQQL